MVRRVILSERVHKESSAHLLSHYGNGGEGHEDLCFAIWRPSNGQDTQTALINEIILPKNGERNLHGNASFELDFLQRAVNHAYREKAGLAFMHSHPCDGWQPMSRDDIRTERYGIAPNTRLLNLPLVGMTIGTDESWSARFWEDGRNGMEKHECERVNVAGGKFQTTFHPQVPPFERREEFWRTTNVWGECAQNKLARIRFGVVGLGSVGCVVAELLSRMGVQHITLIDNDRVKLHNLDRLLYATKDDAEGDRCEQLKVNFFAKQLEKFSTASKARFTVRPIPHTIEEPQGFKAALDCDILFGCVDTNYGRYILNHIAYAHMVPVFEGGISAIPKNGKIAYPSWATNAVYPGACCLSCLGQIDYSAMSDEISGERNDPSYTGPRQKEMPNENVFVFSTHLASTEVLQMLRQVVADVWTAMPNTVFSYRRNELTAKCQASCESDCKFPGKEGLGDQATDHLIQTVEMQPIIESAPNPQHGFWQKIRGWFLGQGN